MKWKRREEFEHEVHLLEKFVIWVSNDSPAHQHEVGLGNQGRNAGPIVCRSPPGVLHFTLRNHRHDEWESMKKGGDV
jgi:hypothetical protein